MTCPEIPFIVPLKPCPACGPSGDNCDPDGFTPTPLPDPDLCSEIINGYGRPYSKPIGETWQRSTVGTDWFVWKFEIPTDSEVVLFSNSNSWDRSVKVWVYDAGIYEQTPRDGYMSTNVPRSGSKEEAEQAIFKLIPDQGTCVSSPEPTPEPTPEPPGTCCKQLNGRGTLRAWENDGWTYDNEFNTESHNLGPEIGKLNYVGEPFLLDSGPHVGRYSRQIGYHTLPGSVFAEYDYFVTNTPTSTFCIEVPEGVECESS